VQQSHSRLARRTPSPRMTKVTVHEKQKVNEERLNPAAAHHTITTARRPDNTRSSALVRGRSTQFMASPGRLPQRRSPETWLHFRHFRGSFPRERQKETERQRDKRQTHTAREREREREKERERERERERGRVKDMNSVSMSHVSCVLYISVTVITHCLPSELRDCISENDYLLCVTHNRLRE